MSVKLLSVLLLSGLAAPCAAQAFGDDADAGIQIAPAKKISFFANGHSSFSFDGRTSSRQGGSVSTYSIDTSITAAIPIDDATDLTVTVGQDSTAYDFSSFDSFGVARRDPLDYGLQTGVSASATHSLDREWTLFGGASVNSNMEIGADFEDTLTFGGFFGIMHHIHEDLSVGIAIAAFTRLEDDATIAPLPTVRWNIDDYWTLNAGGSTTTGNPGIEITHELNDHWDIGASVTVDHKQFRLKDDNIGLPDGVFEDFAVPVMFLVTYAPEPNFSISGMIGATAYRELQLRNSSGNSVSDANIDPTFVFGVAGEFRF